MKSKNKKAIGLFLSIAVALCVVVPGTLAAEADTDVSDNPISIGEVSDQGQNNLEMPVDVETPSDADKECTCITNEDGTLTYTEDCPVHEAPAPVEPETPSDDDKECTCITNEDGTLTYTEGCPVHEAPTSDEPEAPKHIEGCSDDCTLEGCTCSCHAENPETPAEPEKPVHIEGCSDECDGVDCKCECHKLGLFDRLMKCETYAEIMDMIEATPEEELMALTSEQVAQVEEKIQALEPQPLPEIIIEGTDDEPVVSEIIYPTVNFDNVAPFGEPVVG